MERELLAGYGISYDKGIKNCMGNPELYRTLLRMFLDDESFPKAESAYEERDYKKLFEGLHELKGVSGNAGLSELYDAVAPLVELVRGRTEDDIEVDRQFKAAKIVYERAYEGISQWLKKTENL